MIQNVLEKYKTVRNKIAFVLIVLDTPGDMLYNLFPRKHYNFYIIKVIKAQKVEIQSL
jgi:hypothetical protein